MVENKKIKFILTDLDGIIRVWSNEKVSKYEKVNGLDYGSIHEIFFESTLLNNAITGIITDDEWREEISLLLKDKYPDLNIDELADLLRNEKYTINHKVFGLYKKYFPESLLILTTNATSRLDLDLEKDNIISLFDFIYNSSEIGVAKPQDEYYLRIKEDLGFMFDEIIYIDDSLKNIEAAHKLGITSHYFKDLGSLEVFLKEFS